MKLLTLLAVIAFCFTSVARAEGEHKTEHASEGHSEGSSEHKGPEIFPKWEVGGGATAYFTSSTSDGVKSQSYRLIGDLDRFITAQIEFGVHAEFDMDHQGETTSSLELLVGPTYNFSKDVDTSFFIQARAGIVLEYLGASVPNFHPFAYLVNVGKRFEMAEGIAFMPTVGYTGTASATSNGFTLPSVTAWVIVPLQFSFTVN